MERRLVVLTGLMFILSLSLSAVLAVSRDQEDPDQAAGQEKYCFSKALCMRFNATGWHNKHSRVLHVCVARRRDGAPCFKYAPRMRASQAIGHEPGALPPESHGPVNYACVF